METKEILQRYYDGIAQIEGWQFVISDKIVFTGPSSKTTGKSAYIEGTAGFLRVVNHSAVVRMIIDGDQACTIVHYDLLSPSGNELSCEVAEIMSVSNKQIESSSIFFDNVAFKNFMAEG